MFIKKHWKTILLFAAIFIAVFLILFIISLSNQRLKEAEINADTSVLNYNVFAGWKGTNGEVVKSLTVEGTNLYLACGYDGFYVFDYLTLNKLSSFSTDYSVNDISVKTYLTNTFAFLAVGGFNNQGGLLICSIKDLSNISIINSVLTDDLNVQSLYVVTSNDRQMDILITDNKTGYRYFSYDAEKNDLLLKKTTNPSAYTSIDIEANKKVVCVASKEGTIYIYNWEGILQSKISNSLAMPNNIFINMDTLSVADRMNGVMLYDLSSPKNPRYLTSYNTSGDTFDVLKNGDKIIIADGMNGVILVKMENNDTFTLEKQYNDGALYNKLFYIVSNDILYAESGKDGIKILK